MQECTCDPLWRRERQVMTATKEMVATRTAAHIRMKNMWMSSVANTENVLLVSILSFRISYSQTFQRDIRKWYSLICHWIWHIWNWIFQQCIYFLSWGENHFYTHFTLGMIGSPMSWRNWNHFQDMDMSLQHPHYCNEM